MAHWTQGWALERFIFSFSLLIKQFCITIINSMLISFVQFDAFGAYIFHLISVYWCGFRCLAWILSITQLVTSFIASPKLSIFQHYEEWRRITIYEVMDCSVSIQSLIDLSLIVLRRYRKPVRYTVVTIYLSLFWLIFMHTYFNTYTYTSRAVTQLIRSHIFSS